MRKKHKKTLFLAATALTLLLYLSGYLPFTAFPPSPSPAWTELPPPTPLNNQIGAQYTTIKQIQTQPATIQWGPQPDVFITADVNLNELSQYDWNDPQKRYEDIYLYFEIYSEEPNELSFFIRDGCSETNCAKGWTTGLDDGTVWDSLYIPTKTWTPVRIRLTELYRAASGCADTTGDCRNRFTGIFWTSKRDVVCCPWNTVGIPYQIRNIKLLTRAQPILCGDGIVSGSEECDDANNNNNDNCVNTCQHARCGDGFIHTGIETCDDGNQIPGDGCNETCHIERGTTTSSTPTTQTTTTSTPTTQTTTTSTSTTIHQTTSTTLPGGGAGGTGDQATWILGAAGAIAILRYLHYL